VKFKRGPPQSSVRPTGLTVLAALVGLSGFAGLFIGNWYIVLGLVGLLTAWGLWTMKKWARTVALLFAAVLGIVGLACFLIPFVGWILGLPLLIMAGLTFSYLQKPDVKQLFVK
jgi:dolichyl-phosphate-mannose--protein O-mannosyl transferase